jgi:hypothetical protein
MVFKLRAKIVDAERQLMLDESGDFQTVAERVNLGYGTMVAIIAVFYSNKATKEAVSICILHYSL